MIQGNVKEGVTEEARCGHALSKGQAGLRLSLS